MDSDDVKRLMATIIFAGLDSPSQGDEEWACRKAQDLYALIGPKEAQPAPQAAQPWTPMQAQRDEVLKSLKALVKRYGPATGYDGEQRTELMVAEVAIKRAEQAKRTKK